MNNPDNVRFSQALVLETGTPETTKYEGHEELDPRTVALSKVAVILSTLGGDTSLLDEVSSEIAAVYDISPDQLPDIRAEEKYTPVGDSHLISDDKYAEGINEDGDRVHTNL